MSGFASDALFEGPATIGVVEHLSIVIGLEDEGFAVSEGDLDEGGDISEVGGISEGGAIGILEAVTDGVGGIV